MKKVVIGRGHECDVRIDDETDMVSRRQAIVTFSPTGKMNIYDVSTNGTFVNGKRVPKPEGCPLHKSDSVTFGSLYAFDLKRLRDPYTKLRTSVIVGIIVLVVCGAAAAVYFSCDTVRGWFKTEKPVEPENKSEVHGGETVGDMLQQEDTIVPTEAVKPAQSVATPAKTSQKPKKNNASKPRNVSKAGNDSKPADNDYGKENNEGQIFETQEVDKI